MYENTTTTKLRQLPRLNVALITTDSDLVDAALCARLLAAELKSRLGASSSSSSESHTQARISALLAARAVRDGAPVPAEYEAGGVAMPANNSATGDTKQPAETTPHVPVTRTSGSSQRASSASRRRAESDAQAENDRRRAYLKAHWPLWELVQTAEDVPVIFLHALPGEDELAAQMEEASANSDDVTLGQCTLRARAELLATLEEACQCAGLSSDTCSDVTVVWTVRRACLLAALASSVLAGSEPAARRALRLGVEIIPRAVFYLQPGAAESQSGGAEGGQKRSAANTKNGTRGNSAPPKKAGASSSSRPAGRRTSGTSKTRGGGASTSNNNRGASASETFNFFFDEQTQGYDAAAAERFVYGDCQDFATFLERQTQFHAQLRQLQSWQMIAASSAFATRQPSVPSGLLISPTTATPPSTATSAVSVAEKGAERSPAVIAADSCLEASLDSPFAGVLFAEDGDRLMANYDAFVASTTGAVSLTPAESADSGSVNCGAENALRLLEDCLLAQRVPVPSLRTLAAWQAAKDELSGTRLNGAGASGSSTTSLGASASTSSRKKTATGTSSGASASASLAASALLAPATTSTLSTTQAAQHVILPAWLLVTIPVSTDATGAAAVTEKETDDGTAASLASLAADLPALVQHISTVLSPLLGVVHLYDQWCRHRPLYPLPSRVLSSTTGVAGAAREMRALLAPLCTTTGGGESCVRPRDDFGSTHMSSTLGGLSAAEAERVFFLGTTGSDLQAEMVRDGDAPVHCGRGTPTSAEDLPFGSASAATAPFADSMHSARPAASPSGGAGTAATTAAAAHDATRTTGHYATAPGLTQDIGVNPAGFARYQEQKRRAGTFTPMTATVALLSQTLTNLERNAPLRLVKLAERGGAPQSLLFATTQEGRDDFRSTLNAVRTETCVDAARMGVRVEDSEGGAHFASSPFHRRRNPDEANASAQGRGRVPPLPLTPPSDGGHSRLPRSSFFRPYTQTLLGAHGDNCGTTSVLPHAAAVRRQGRPNAELEHFLEGRAASQHGAAEVQLPSSAKSQRNSHPSTARKKSSRSPSPGDRSGSRAGGGADGGVAGGSLSGIAAMAVAAREAAAAHAQAEAARRADQSGFVVPNDHAAEQPLPPPYPQEVQWLVEQYVKRGLGFFALSRSGGDTATSNMAASLSMSGRHGGSASHNGSAINNNNNAVYVLAVRRMRELQGLPLRLSVPELAAAFLASSVKDANVVLKDKNVPGLVGSAANARSPTAQAKNGGATASPQPPLTPLDLVKRCALPLSTFEVQLQRSVERSLTSRERQHALQKVLLVELARAGGLLSYTTIEDVAAHTSGLGAIEEVVSQDVVQRELLRCSLRFGDHLTVVYTFKDKPPPMMVTGGAVDVLSYDAATSTTALAEPLRTSTYSHGAENVFPPRRAETMWVAGVLIPPTRRRQMVFVHPYLGRLSCEQFMAVKAALAACDTGSGGVSAAQPDTHTKNGEPLQEPPTAERARLSTSLYAQLLRQHLEKKSFFAPYRGGSPREGGRTVQDRLSVPPLRMAAEGRHVIYPYCDAVVEVTTTALARRCAYMKHKEVTASLEYAVAPPPPHATSTPPSPESHAYLSVQFDDGLILTCTPQSLPQPAVVASVDAVGVTAANSTAARRPRSNTEPDAEGPRPTSRRASFVDSHATDSIMATSAEGKRSGRGGGAGTMSKSKTGVSARVSRVASNAFSAPTSQSAHEAAQQSSQNTAMRAVIAKALQAPTTAVAPIGPSGSVRLWHARVTPPPATAAPPSRTPEEGALSSAPARPVGSPTGRSVSGFHTTRQGTRGPAARETLRTAAATTMTVTTNNFVLRCHPTMNTVSMHYFGEERRPGSFTGDGCTTQWDTVDVVQDYRGADSRVVASVEREVARTVDINTGTVTRVFESGVTQFLFPDGAVSTRYPVEAVVLAAAAASAPTPFGQAVPSTLSTTDPNSPTLPADAAPSAAAGTFPPVGALQRCVVELITSASGIRYVRRVTSGGAAGEDGSARLERVAHRTVRLTQDTVEEVAAYDPVHHCHMLSRSDGVCTTYYYRRRTAGDGDVAVSPDGSATASAMRMTVQTPSSARKFANGNSTGGAGSSSGGDRAGDFDVVARVTLHADGTTITTFAATPFAKSVTVSPALAPLLDDVATVEAACGGGGAAGAAGSAFVRWAVESARMPRLFLIPPVTPLSSLGSHGAAGMWGEGTAITPFAPAAATAGATRIRVGGAGMNAAATAAAAQTRHDAKAGFYVMFGDGTTLRRNVQMRSVGQMNTAFLETVLTRPSATSVRVVHDSAMAIIEPAEAMESNRANPAALAVAECLPMFDLALGGFRLVDRRSYVTEIRNVFTPMEVDMSFTPHSWQQLLRQLVSPTYSPHRLPKQKVLELQALQAEETAAEKLTAEAGKWCSLLRRLRDLAEGYVVDNKLLHPDVLHNFQRTRFITGTAGASRTSGSLDADESGANLSVCVPQKEDNHLIGISPTFFARLASGEFVQYLGAADLQGILRQTDVEAGAPMFLSRGTASGEPGVQQLTLFRVSVQTDTSETVTSSALLAANNLNGGGPSMGSPNASLSATGTRRGVTSARLGTAKAVSSYAQSSILSAFIERQQRLAVLFSGTTPASNYLHSSAKGSTGFFLDTAVAHPVTVLRGSSRWLPPALQPPRRFLRQLPAHSHGLAGQLGSAASPSRGHRLVRLEEDAKLAEDLQSGNTSSFELVRVFLQYEQLTLPAQNVVLQSEIHRSSALQELGRYHEAMTSSLAEVTPDKLEEQRRLQEIYYAARKAKKAQDA